MKDEIITKQSKTFINKITNNSNHKEINLHYLLPFFWLIFFDNFNEKLELFFNILL